MRIRSFEPPIGNVRGRAVNFDLSPEQEQWREQVRGFLRDNVTPGLERELHETGGHAHGPEERAFQRKVAERGWYGLNWPRAYGGLEKSAVEQFILIEEFNYRGAPSLPITITSLGPIILRYGTEENRRNWIPRIVSGEVDLALGYSEPDAGTDLANLKTRADWDGAGWVVNGQKIWNSGAHTASHEWLAVRTDPDAPRHQGISVLIVPIDHPGVEVRPLWTWGDVRTNQIFFRDVRVPAENLIGEVHRGWTYIAAALDFERVAIGAMIGSLRRGFEGLVEHCKRSVVDGEILGRRPSVRARLAELDVELEIARLLALETASLVDAGKIPTREGSAVKFFVTELQTKLGHWGTRLQDLYGQLDRNDPDAPVGGALESMYRRAPFLRFGGGTNEIQRDIVAQRGLGLPRARRGR